MKILFLSLLRICVWLVFKELLRMTDKMIFMDNN